MNATSIEEELACVLVEFRSKDYSELAASIEQARDRVLNFTTDTQHSFVWLMFYLTLLTAAGLKGVALPESESIANAAYEYADASPSKFVCAIAGFAGECRMREKSDVGYFHLSRAVRRMDESGSWVELSPAAEPAIRAQLQAMQS